jgi:hypothetical protein
VQAASHVWRVGNGGCVKAHGGFLDWSVVAALSEPTSGRRRQRPSRSPRQVRRQRQPRRSPRRVRRQGRQRRARRGPRRGAPARSTAAAASMPTSGASTAAAASSRACRQSRQRRPSRCLRRAQSCEPSRRRLERRRRLLCVSPQYSWRAAAAVALGSAARSTKLGAFTPPPFVRVAAVLSASCGCCASW